MQTLHTNPKPSPMDGLWRRMTAANIPWSYVRQTALPSWWRDELAHTATGFAQGAMLIARHTGLDVIALLTPDAPLVFDASCAVPKFKQRKGSDAEAHPFAANVAVQTVCLAAETVRAEYVPLPSTVAELRARIQRETVREMITLDSLLSWCWSQGIGVLHLSELPAHKPQALVVRVAGRPMIVVCENAKFDAKLAFWIAHELTHVALGHVSENGVRVETTESLSSTEGEEKAANDGACELLLGIKEAKFRIVQPHTARTLATKVLERGNEHDMDPGAILLNISYHQPEHIALITGALKIVDRAANAPAKVREAMTTRMDVDALPSDDAAFLRRVCGWEGG